MKDTCACRSISMHCGVIIDASRSRVQTQDRHRECFYPLPLPSLPSTNSYLRDLLTQLVQIESSGLKQSRVQHSMGDQVCGAVHAQGPCSVGLKPSSGCQTETDTDTGAEEGLTKRIQSSPAPNTDCTVLHCTATALHCAIVRSTAWSGRVW